MPVDFGLFNPYCTPKDSNKINSSCTECTKDISSVSRQKDNGKVQMKCHFACAKSLVINCCKIRGYILPRLILIF